MQRTVNDMSSHNNMLVPEEAEIVIERTVHHQDELLKKENQLLKVRST